jgi:hemolysin activation/secretion protein
MSSWKTRSWRAAPASVTALVALVVAGSPPAEAGKPFSPGDAKRASDSASPASKAPSPLIIETSDAAVKPDKPEPCFPVETVTVSGIELVDRGEIADVIRPLAGRCQGNTLVKGILVAINGVYAKHGFVTTQAYLPKQDLKTAHKLAIEIKVGRIAEVRYEEVPVWAEGPYFERLGKRFREIFSANDLTAFFSSLDRFVETIDDPLEQPLIANPAARVGPATVIHKGEPLELEAMQQGLDVMNKSASSKAQAKLEPGPDPASSVVVIKNAPTDAFRVIAGYDTYGTRATGVQRARLDMARDNLIGVNDTWKASLTSAANSNELSAGFALPVQWFVVTFDTKYSETLVPLGAFAELFAQNASATLAGVATVQRTPAERLDLSLGVRLSGNDRTINDVALTPQRFFAIQAGLTKSWTLGKTGMLTVGVTGSKGLDAWIATQDPTDAGATTPRAQFKKVEGSLNLNWAPVEGITVSSALSTQWSNTPLYSVEQLTLGSLSTIRGFKDAPFSVDRGGHWRNDIAARLPVDAMIKTFSWNVDPWIANRFRALEGYVFVDAGYGEDVANRRNDLLIGTGVGLRYRDSRITADWSVARGVYENAKSAPDSTEMYLNIGVKTF